MCGTVFQHCVLAIKAAVAYFIPDTPRWVQVKMAKMEYESKQALVSFWTLFFVCICVLLWRERLVHIYRKCGPPITILTSFIKVLVGL